MYLKFEEHDYVAIQQALFFSIIWIDVRPVLPAPLILSLSLLPQCSSSSGRQSDIHCELNIAPACNNEPENLFGV